VELPKNSIVRAKAPAPANERPSAEKEGFAKFRERDFAAPKTGLTNNSLPSSFTDIAFAGLFTFGLGTKGAEVVSFFIRPILAVGAGL
jgi:hypothetical protein